MEFKPCDHDARIKVAIRPSQETAQKGPQSSVPRSHVRTRWRSLHAPTRPDGSSLKTTRPRRHSSVFHDVTCANNETRTTPVIEYKPGLALSLAKA